MQLSFTRESIRIKDARSQAHRFKFSVLVSCKLSVRDKYCINVMRFYQQFTWGQILFTVKARLDAWLSIVPQINCLGLIVRVHHTSRSRLWSFNTLEHVLTWPSNLACITTKISVFHWGLLIVLSLTTIIESSTCRLWQRGESNKRACASYDFLGISLASMALFVHFLTCYMVSLSRKGPPFFFFSFLGVKARNI